MAPINNAVRLLQTRRMAVAPLARFLAAPAEIEAPTRLLARALENAQMLIAGIDHAAGVLSRIGEGAGGTYVRINLGMTAQGAALR